MSSPRLRADARGRPSRPTRWRRVLTAVPVLLVALLVTGAGETRLAPEPPAPAAVSTPAPPVAPPPAPPVAPTPAPPVVSRVDVGANPLVDGVPLPARGSATALPLVRIWDDSVTWAQVEPAAPVAGVHTYDWTALDRLVDQAADTGARVLYVLYGTPAWAAAGCTVNYTGGCPLYPDDPQNWSAYVAAVAQHLHDRGRAVDYEVWNEPNLGPAARVTYWTGTDAQLYDLGRRAHDAVRAAAPDAQVACCSWNRLAAVADGTGAIDRWLALGGGDTVNAVSYHPYPHLFDPADAGVITDHVVAALARNRVSRPLWATEVGFENTVIAADGSVSAVHAWSQDEQADLVRRTLDVLRSRHVARMVWYPWNETDPGGLDTNMLGLRRVIDQVPWPPPAA